MGQSASYLPSAVAGLAREGRWSALFLGTLSYTSPTWLLLPLMPSAIRRGRADFSDAWFGRFWSWAGPQVKSSGEARVVPLLDGRTRGGRVTETPTGPGLGGVVIEIGAGSGMWVDVLAGRDEEKKKGQANARTEVTRVYGIEPNKDHHSALRRRIAEVGFGDVYEVVPVGIEDIGPSNNSGGDKGTKKWDGQIAPESVDCIVSVLCLCSIPDQEKNVRELYRYLKKGGRWYVYEHVRCEYSWYMKFYQGEFVTTAPRHFEAY